MVGRSKCFDQCSCIAHLDRSFAMLRMTDVVLMIVLTRLLPSSPARMNYPFGRAMTGALYLPNNQRRITPAEA